MQRDLIEQIAHALWSPNALQQIEELLNAHVENCGQHKHSILEGRRRHLRDVGVLLPLPSVPDQLQVLRESGDGYVHQPSVEYSRPVRPRPKTRRCW